MKRQIWNRLRLLVGSGLFIVEVDTGASELDLNKIG